MNRTGRLGIWLVGAGAIALLCRDVQAQSVIVPDATLGVGSSQVLQNFNGLPVEAIINGAQRGQNLFHSFQEFNIAAGRGAFFFSPAPEIRNILARVTGNNPSQILGTLGTFGNSQPNLFLMNPNGIIFGRNASLNVGGSFIATTANGIQFPGGGTFSQTSTVDPVTPLLSVNPSAFLFNQLNAGRIVNQSTTPLGTTPLGVSLIGLQVPARQSVVLVGGNVTLDGGGINVPGGRVEIGSVAGTGTVGLVQGNDGWRLQVPGDLARGDVAIGDRATVNVAAAAGGSISIYAHNLELTGGSFVRAGLESGVVATSQVGDITLDATDETRLSGQDTAVANLVRLNSQGNSGTITVNTGSLTVEDQANFTLGVVGQGNSGNLVINARNRVVFDNGDVFADTTASGVGNSGSIQITTGVLTLQNGGQLIASNSGVGNTGSVIINARDRILIDGLPSSAGFRSGIYNALIGTGAEQPGDIQITTSALTLINQGQISAGISGGRGRAGNIVIQASGPITLQGGNILNRIESEGQGTGGNISITADSMSLTEQGQIVIGVQGTEQFPVASQGNAGSISLKIGNRLTLNGPFSQISSGTGRQVVGNGGTIAINAGTLRLSDQSSILSSSLSQGRGGSMTIQIAGNLTLEQGGGISSLLVEGGAGQGGNISIQAGSLSLSNTLGIDSSTTGQGDGGNIDLQVQETTQIRNASIRSGALSTIGNGGDITITTGSLVLQTEDSPLASQIYPSIPLPANSADFPLVSQIGTSSLLGRGNSGDIQITARDGIVVQGGNGTGISSALSESIGQGGTITINTGTFSLSGGALLSSSTSGLGNAGEIDLTARDRISLDNSFVFSNNVNPVARGNSGMIRIHTPDLSLNNIAGISSGTSGQGNAGDIEIEARDRVSLASNASISSTVNQTAQGSGGTISLRTGNLALNSDAQINVSTLGQGNAGEVNIEARDRVSVTTGAGIFSAVGGTAQGNGGAINVRTNALSLTDGGLINSGTQGRGNAGDITVKAGDFVSLRNDSSIASPVLDSAEGNGGIIQILTTNLTATQQSVIFVGSVGQGVAGNIDIQANRIQIRNFSQVSAETANGDGGNISLDVGSLLLLRDRSNISTTAGNSQAGGNGGNITINAAEGFLVALPLENSDITANAFTGRGGKVEITAQGIFGLQFRPQLTPFSDITASSTFGTSGVVTLNTPNVDPERGLVALPADVVDSSGLIVQRCVAQRNPDTSSSFYITGRGGLPYRPGDLPASPFSTGTVRPVIDSAPTTLIPATSNSPTPASTPEPTPIVEATHWIHDGRGNVFLVAEARNTPKLNLPECPPLAP